MVKNPFPPATKSSATRVTAGRTATLQLRADPRGAFSPARELGGERGDHQPNGHNRDQDGADGVNLRLHAETDLRIDAERQRGRARAGGEAREDEVIER